MDYYEILGINKSATADEVKAAYRKSAKKYHPDVNKEPGAEEKFKAATEAYEVLSNEQSRSNYDKYGTAEAPNMGSPFGSPFGGGFDPASMFEEFFGRSRQHIVNSDITVQIELEPKEFLNGVKKTINLTKQTFCTTCDGEGGSEPVTCSSCMGKGVRTQQVQNGPFTMMQTVGCNACSGKGKTFKTKCNDCSGSGQIQKTDTVELSIPSMCPVFSTLQMLNHGHCEHKNLTPCSLYVRLSVSETQDISVDSDGNVHIKQDISINDWYNNNDVEINRFNVGKIKYNLKELTRSTQQLSFPNQGLKDARNQNQGDLIVTFRINK